jgi:hypothetical protein
MPVKWLSSYSKVDSDDFMDQKVKIYSSLNQVHYFPYWATPRLRSTALSFSFKVDYFV